MNIIFNSQSSNQMFIQDINKYYENIELLKPLLLLLQLIYEHKFKMWITYTCSLYLIMHLC